MLCSIEAWWWLDRQTELRLRRRSCSVARHHEPSHVSGCIRGEFILISQNQFYSVLFCFISYCCLHLFNREVWRTNGCCHILLSTWQSCNWQEVMAGNKVAERLTVLTRTLPSFTAWWNSFLHIVERTIISRYPFSDFAAALIRFPSVPLVPPLSDLIALSIVNGPCCGEFRNQQLPDSKLLAHQISSLSLLRLLIRALNTHLSVSIWIEQFPPGNSVFIMKRFISSHFHNVFLHYSLVAFKYLLIAAVKRLMQQCFRLKSLELNM